MHGRIPANIITTATTAAIGKLGGGSSPGNPPPPPPLDGVVVVDGNILLLDPEVSSGMDDVVLLGSEVLWYCVVLAFSGYKDVCSGASDVCLALVNGIAVDAFILCVVEGTCVDSASFTVVSTSTTVVILVLV